MVVVVEEEDIVEPEAFFSPVMDEDIVYAIGFLFYRSLVLLCFYVSLRSLLSTASFNEIILSFDLAHSVRRSILMLFDRTQFLKIVHKIFFRIVGVTMHVPLRAAPKALVRNL